MANPGINRILVYVKNHNLISVPANFKQCIFKQLGIEDTDRLCCMVHCKLQNNNLFLELISQNEEKNTGFMLKHPPFCPVQALTDEESTSLPEEVLNRGVDVGVSVILESSDENILLTRRAAHMRTFPGVWVPPGGHIKLNESLEEAGLRELQEETGLKFSPQLKRQSGILALWESVFPPVLMHGFPKRHHIVVYLHVAVDKTSNELQQLLKLDSEEVDASLWLPLSLSESIVSGEPLQEPIVKQLKFLQLNEKGDQVPSAIDPSALERKMPSPGVDVERVSTGTRICVYLNRLSAPDKFAFDVRWSWS